MSFKTTPCEADWQCVLTPGREGGAWPDTDIKQRLAKRTCQKHDADNYMAVRRGPAVAGRQAGALNKSTASISSSAHLPPPSVWLNYEANKRLACHNESGGPVAGRQCESVSGTGSAALQRACLAPPPKINSASRREKKRQCLQPCGFIFSRSEKRRRPLEGHPDGFACHSPSAPTCCKFMMAASRLPQQQLGGLFKAKWCLRAVRRHIGKRHALRRARHARTHTPTLVFLAPSGEKAASNSNHGDQNTAVSGCRTQSDASDEVPGLFFRKRRSRRRLFRSNFAAAVHEIVKAGASLGLGPLQPGYFIQRGSFPAALSAKMKPSG